LSPADHRPGPIAGGPDLGTTIADWPDDYAAVDVRGKVAVVLRAPFVATGTRQVRGPDPETAIRDALKRGPAAVIYVDPDLPSLPRVQTRAAINGYTRLAEAAPMGDPSRPPVLVLSRAAADTLLAPVGILPSAIYGALPRNFAGAVIAADSSYAKRSAARDVDARAAVDVPIARDRAHVRSLVGATAEALSGDRGRPTRAVLVWAVLRPEGARSALDAMVALARSVATSGIPVVFVAFDPTIDPDGNAAAVAERLAGVDTTFVVVLDALEGSALQFRSVNGDLIAAFDLYTERAGARHVATRTTIDPNAQSYDWPGIRPFIRERSIVMTGTGGDGDLRGDAAATLGYMAGRLALGAEELR
jgi:hypothetical protein